MKKDYNKKYYQENREKIRACRQANKEKIKARQKIYHQMNKEKINEWQKIYRQRNKEKMRIYDKKCKQKKALLKFENQLGISNL